jgi:four helix bundle protein
MNIVLHQSTKHFYRDLVVWQRAIELVTDIYRRTASFPDHERFGLTSQLRRAAVSVPSNIAEGQGRFTRGEFRQFLGQARGSLLEIETQITICRNLGYMREVETEELLERTGEVGRMLNGLVQSLG